MNPQRILVVGRHQDILGKAKELLASAGYVPLGAVTDAQALEIIITPQLDAMVLGGGVEAVSRVALTQAFRSTQPGRPIVEQFGGVQGLLGHIQAALRLGADESQKSDPHA